MTALLLAILLASDAEEVSYGDIRRLFCAETPAPELPAGLRAPPTSERHKRAQAQYAEAVAAWHDRERARRRQLEDACTRHLGTYPKGARSLDVVYLRGATRFREIVVGQ